MVERSSARQWSESTLKVRVPDSWRWRRKRPTRMVVHLNIAVLVASVDSKRGTWTKSSTYGAVKIVTKLLLVMANIWKENTESATQYEPSTDESIFMVACLPTTG